jgi:predicted enzyme related to lactoylglutathione lyase
MFGTLLSLRCSGFPISLRSEYGRSGFRLRMMFNLETKDVEAEFDRIKKLGATVVAKPYHPKEDPKGTIATFADPDANLFQLVTPRESG